MKIPQGFISDIAHGATKDGPGWRSVVYFKGCNFSCRWCGAPESIPFGKSILTYEDGSVETVGRAVTVEEVVEEIRPYKRFSRRDLPYGVTLTGGEATCQWPFYLELLIALKKAGFHTAVETNASSPRLVESLPYLDLVICDLKHMDPEQHRAWVGADNRRVLENIKAIYETQKPLWIRIPIVPGYNDTTEHLQAVARFLVPMREGLKVELLKYSRMGVHKWKALRQGYPLKDLAPPSDERILELEEILRAHRIEVFRT